MMCVLCQLMYSLLLDSTYVYYGIVLSASFWLSCNTRRNGVLAIINISIYDTDTKFGDIQVKAAGVQGQPSISINNFNPHNHYLHLSTNSVSSMYPRLER